MFKIAGYERYVLKQEVTDFVNQRNTTEIDNDFIDVLYKLYTLLKYLKFKHFNRYFDDIRNFLARIKYDLRIGKDSQSKFSLLLTELKKYLLLYISENNDYFSSKKFNSNDLKNAIENIKNISENIFDELIKFAKSTLFISKINTLRKNLEFDLELKSDNIKSLESFNEDFSSRTRKILKDYQIFDDNEKTKITSILDEINNEISSSQKFYISHKSASDIIKIINNFVKLFKSLNFNYEFLIKLKSKLDKDSNHHYLPLESYEEEILITEIIPFLLPVFTIFKTEINNFIDGNLNKNYIINANDKFWELMEKLFYYSVFKNRYIEYIRNIKNEFNENISSIEEPNIKVAKKKNKRVDLDVRPQLLFRNYDYSSNVEPSEVSPGGGLYHGSIGRFKSVEEFLKKKRKLKKQNELLTTSQLFIKLAKKSLAYYPVDKEDFSAFKRRFEENLRNNKMHLTRFIFWVKLQHGQTYDVDKFLDGVSAMGTKRHLIENFQHNHFISLNIPDIWFTPSVFFSDFGDIGSIEETRLILKELHDEFSKIQIFFNSFTPTLNYIDSEYIDIDSYIISYLEFFVKLIEEYEDIFSLARSDKKESFEIRNNLSKTKNYLYNKISELQERNPPDPTEEEIESMFREVADLAQDPEYEDPQVIEEQEELVKEFKERRKLREEIKDPENIKYETWE